jgi:hypothetical protein
MSAAPADNEANDDIFADKGPPLGSDPFALNEAAITANIAAAPAEPSPAAQAPATASDDGNALLAIASTGLEHQLSFDEFLHRIASVFTAVTGGMLGCFFERSLADHGCAARGSGLRLTDGEGFIAFAIVEKRPVFSDEAPNGAPYFQWLAEASGIHASRAVSVPIFIRGQCFGAVEVYDPTVSATPEMSRTLSDLATMAAIAVETRLTLAQSQQTDHGAAEAA